MKQAGFSSPARDQNCAPCSGGVQSQPLDHQGSTKCLFICLLYLMLICSYKFFPQGGIHPRLQMKKLRLRERLSELAKVGQQVLTAGLLGKSPERLSCRLYSILSLATPGCLSYISVYLLLKVGRYAVFLDSSQPHQGLLPSSTNSPTPSPLTSIVLTFGLDASLWWGPFWTLEDVWQHPWSLLTRCQ